MPVVLGLLVGEPVLHPNSVSVSLVVVEGAQVELRLRCQALSVIEVLPEVDGDGDGRLAAGELDAAKGEIGGYLLGRYRLLGGQGVLEGRLEELGLLGEAAAGPLELEWLEARFSYRAAAPLETLEIQVSLFREQSPIHRDIAGVVWNGEEEVRHVFTAGSPRWTFEPEAVRRPGVLGSFVRFGVEHILTGWDHLAFLLALLVASTHLRALVGVVTAFTVAHSITLAAAALDPGGLLDGIPDRFVELAIALSIAYVGAETLLRREARNPWLEALGFGLLHGLGFAGFLRDALAGETLIVTALFGFNLGVELGQLAVVVALVAPLILWKRLRRGKAVAAVVKPALAPSAVRMGASACVVVAGLYWFAERAGWL